VCSSPNRIFNVLLLRSGVEMMGIDATRNIAFMANHFPVRDSAMLPLIGVPMGENSQESSVIPSNVEHPVAVFDGTARPQMATAHWFWFNVKHEPFII
jgi:hypothetical protein